MWCSFVASLEGRHIPLGKKLKASMISYSCFLSFRNATRMKKVRMSIKLSRSGGTQPLL